MDEDMRIIKYYINCSEEEMENIYPKLDDLLGEILPSGMFLYRTLDEFPGDHPFDEPEDTLDE
jgi:hypothetical protein